MRLVIDTSQVRLSPAEKLTLSNIVNRQPKPPPLPVGVQESIDNAFGKSEYGTERGGQTGYSGDLR